MDDTGDLILRIGLSVFCVFLVINISRVAIHFWKTRKNGGHYHKNSKVTPINNQNHQMIQKKGIGSGKMNRIIQEVKEDDKSENVTPNSTRLVDDLNISSKTPKNLQDNIKDFSDDMKNFKPRHAKSPSEFQSLMKQIENPSDLEGGSLDSKRYTRLDFGDESSTKRELINKDLQKQNKSQSEAKLEKKNKRC